MMQDLTEWVRANPVDDNLLWREAYSDQICFVRDKLGHKITGRYDGVTAISTHTSKSVKLPVYSIIGRTFTLVMRGNFYDWKVTVNRSIVALPDKFKLKGLKVDQAAKVPHIYCEGFKPEWVFGSFKESACNFTVELRDKYELYTMVDRLMMASS